MSLIALLLVLGAACGSDDDEASDGGGFDRGSDTGGDTGGDDGGTGADGGDGGGVATAGTVAAGEDQPGGADDSSTDGGGDTGGDDGSFGPDIDLAALPPIDLGRDIIFTAEVRVEVDNVLEAVAAAQREIGRFGGFVAEQQTTTDPTPSSLITFRVLPADFDEALASLGGLGELIDQSVTSDDVTERVVDLESRIITAEASVVRLRDLLGDASSLETITQLEQQLLERETQLETLRGSLRTVRGLVGLATIVVRFDEAVEPVPGPEVVLTQSVFPGLDDGFGCPGSSSTRIEEGDEFTVCYEVVNTGDTHLGDVELSDPRLDVEMDDLVVADGTLAEPLAPGERLLLVYNGTADRNVNSASIVTAQPVAQDGTPLDIGRVNSRAEAGIRVEESDALPGFVDGLKSAWGAVVVIGSIGLLVVAWLIPFVWVLAIAAAIWWYRRRVAKPEPIEPVVQEA